MNFRMGYRALALAVAACGTGAPLAMGTVNVAGDAGEVVPADPTTWGPYTPAFVGIDPSKTGSVSVDGGSVITSQYGRLGVSAGSTGTVTVTGVGSAWSNSRDLYLGYSGSGTLSVLNGGRASNGGDSGQAYVGYNSGSIGTVTVAGAGSTWSLNGDAYATYVGYSGTGTLNIQNGGTVVNSSTSGRAFMLGYNPGSTGTARVTGAGSTWSMGGCDLYVGRSGSGTLNIEDGGTLVSGYGGSYIGYNFGSTGAATVAGIGSTWSSYYLMVGYGGGGTLIVRDGGVVTTDELFASFRDLKGDGTINVHGLVADVDLMFDKTHGRIQSLPFGTGGTLNLDISSGASAVGVGHKGQGALRIAEGVVISSSAGYIGDGAGSTGSGTVTGSGSTWNNSGDLYVGYDNARGTLTVQDGGVVTTKTLFASLSDLKGNGIINTQGLIADEDLVFDQTHGKTRAFSFGSGGTLNLDVATGTGSLGAGYSGQGTLRIGNSTLIASSIAYLGYNSGSTGTATVAGAGATWSNSSRMYVGYDGSGTLSIQNGGTVNSGLLYLGYSPGSSGTALVTGAGSTWNSNTSGGSTSFVYIGGSGVGTLSIQNGGTVNSGSGFVGEASGSTGTATVTGYGSTWKNNGSFWVGASGVGTLNIESGGSVSSGTSYLGYSSGAAGTAKVTGAGSNWNSYILYIGYSGNGALNVQNGGAVSSGWNSGDGGFLGYNSGSTGTATIAGAGSRWSNTGSLYIGYSGTGALTIENGGLIDSKDGSYNGSSYLYGRYIGYNRGSVGTVIVKGAGSNGINLSPKLRPE